MEFKRLQAHACFLACVLAGNAAQAQVVPTRAVIRLWEQATNGEIPPERRLYATRFDGSRTRFIGAEISLGFAPATALFSFPIDCELRAPEGQRSYTLKLDIQVVTGSEESRTITSWSRDGDSAWVAGKYQIRCSDRGKELVETAFDVAANPPDASEIDLHVTGLLLFPTSGVLPAKGRRDYQARFAARKTTRIGVELHFTHAAANGGISIPVDCYYYTPRGQPMGPISFNYEPAANSTSGDAALALGWDSTGHWSQGAYTAVCNIRGRPVAVERFAID